MNFGPGKQDDPSKLSDEQIIENSVAARDAGNRDEFIHWVRVFVARRLPMVRGMVRLKISHPEDQENVEQDILVSAMESAHRIQGSHPGEFVNWLKTITRFRIADHHERKKRREDHETPMEISSPDDDEPHLLEIPDLEDEHGAVAAYHLVHRMLADRSEVHRRTIELRMDGHPSRDVVRILGDGAGMTPANVDQVFSRFRKELRVELDRDDG